MAIAAFGLLGPSHGTVHASGGSITPTNTTITISIAWAQPAAEFDLFVLNSSGAVIAANENGIDPTVATIPAVSGNYTIRVDPFNPAGETYTSTVTLAPKASSGAGNPNNPPLYTGVAPRFQNYAIPQTQGGNAGEPSIGVNWNTGNVMYQAGLQMFRVNFDDSTSPARATWTDVSSFETSKTSLDAILFTDHATGRTFVSQLTGADSLSSYTDNDGISHTPSQGGGLPSGLDHQTIGGGPYSTVAAVNPPTAKPITGYPDAVYYCSQAIATAFCARSDDGGLTYGPGVPLYNISQCGGLHGRVKVAPDGTVYVPNKNCGGKAGVAVSTDDGVTWTLRTVPDSSSFGGSDPSVGIGSDGTIYLAYQASNAHTMVAVSHDRGITWSKSLDMGSQLGVQDSVFPEAVAGDGNRASVSFIGTTTSGNYQATGVFPGVWYIYISTTYDGGKSWVTENVTPTDPVQRGSICTGGTTCGTDRNLLDFMDTTIDKQGRVLVAYPDGCVNACVQGGANSFTAYATIARQSGGPGLLSAYDVRQPAAPARPLAYAARTGSTAPVYVTWYMPDNGGSPITSYQILRGTSPGFESLIATTTGARDTYVDSTALPGVTYYYYVRAINAYGYSLLSPVAQTVVVNTKPMCSLPGKLVLTDPTGDQTGAPQNQDLDIQDVYAAEPYLNGANDFVVTMKVASLNSVGPNHQWRMFWDNADGSGNRWYVGMNSDATGAVSFVYGTEQGQNTGVQGSPGIPNTTIPALAGSGYSKSGYITVVVPKSGVGNPAAGATLPNFQARTFAGQGNVTVVLNALAADSTGYSTYQVVGNAYCQ